jgi:hypothetical protein
MMKPSAIALAVLCACLGAAHPRAPPRSEQTRDLPSARTLL